MSFIDFLFGSQAPAPIEDATLRRQALGMQNILGQLAQPGGVQLAAQRLAQTGIDPTQFLAMAGNPSPVVNRPAPAFDLTSTQPAWVNEQLRIALNERKPPPAPQDEKEKEKSTFDLTSEQLLKLQSLMPKPPVPELPRPGQPHATQIGQMAQFAVPQMPRRSLYSILYGGRP